MNPETLERPKSVTLGRFISAWILRQSIAGRSRAVSPGAGNSRRSSSASSIASGTGQLMPITPARRTYSPTTVLPTPVASLICRKLIPSVCLSRNTSRTLRIDNLSAGIGTPFLLRGP